MYTGASLVFGALSWGVLGVLFGHFGGGGLHFGVFFGTFWGIVWYSLRGFLVQFRGVYGTIRGFLWYNKGDFKYTSGFFVYISSGVCRSFPGLFFMHIARRRWLFWD